MKKKTFRYCLDLSVAVEDRVRRLKDSTDAASIAEVIRRALAVYELFARLPGGSRVLIRDADGTEVSVVIT